MIYYDGLVKVEGNKTTYVYKLVSGVTHEVYRTDYINDKGEPDKRIEQQRGRVGKVMPFGNENLVSKYFYVVEGEKACTKLWQFGENCTTEIMGAGKPNLTYWDSYVGREITLIPDNDDPGRQYFKDLANRLAKRNTVFLIDYNENSKPPKWDVGDLKSESEFMDFLRGAVCLPVKHIPPVPSLPPLISLQDEEYFGADQFEELKGRLKGVKQAGDSYVAYCPCHDNTKSQALEFGLSHKDGKLFARCHNASCSAGTSDVFKALGMWKEYEPKDVTLKTLKQVNQEIVKGKEYTTQVLSWEGLKAISTETMDWQLNESIPKGGFFIFTAKPKSGKSTLIRQFCLAVASGQDFLGRPTGKGKVLYCGFEDGANYTRQHFAQLFAYYQDDDLDNILHQFGFIVDPPDVHEQIEKMWWLKHQIDIHKAELCVIDPLMFFLGVEDGNNYNEVLKALRQLKEISRLTGCTIGTVHHSRKADGEDTLDTCLGSTAIAGTFEAIFLLKKTRGKANKGTIETRQRGGEVFEESILDFDFANKRFHLQGAKTEVNKRESDDRVNDFWSGIITCGYTRQDYGLNEDLVSNFQEIRDVVKQHNIDEDYLFKMDELAKGGGLIGRSNKDITAINRNAGTLDNATGKKYICICDGKRGVPKTFCLTKDNEAIARRNRQHSRQDNQNIIDDLPL